MKEIPVGAPGRRHLLVTPETAIDVLGDERARVLSTPHMIAYMEWAARDALLPYLDPNEDSLGTLVNVRHLAATPVGMSVEFTATVTEVQGRRVLFRVEARDEKELVGEGAHERFIADVPRLIARLAAKRAS
jgi:fluoroacetyl-CoA thioesterase